MPQPGSQEIANLRQDGLGQNQGFAQLTSEVYDLRDHIQRITPLAVRDALQLLNRPRLSDILSTHSRAGGG